MRKKAKRVHVSPRFKTWSGELVGRRACQIAGEGSQRAHADLLEAAPVREPLAAGLGISKFYKTSEAKLHHQIVFWVAMAVPLHMSSYVVELILVFLDGFLIRPFLKIESREYNLSLQGRSIGRLKREGQVN